MTGKDMPDEVQEKAANANDVIAYPIAILIAGNQKNPMFQVKLSIVCLHIAYSGAQAMRGC
jgi:hypothetical protein